MASTKCKPKSRKSCSLGCKPIMDATEPFRVRITRRDVAKGSRARPQSCALAKGLTRRKDIVSVRVGYKVALVEFKDKVVRYGIQPEDTEKIRAFDYARYFKPDTYKLVPPKKKLGVHTVGHKRKSGPSGLHVKRRSPLRHVWRA